MTRIKTFLVSAALIVSLALPIYFAGATLATRFGLIDWRLGFGTLTVGYGPMALMGAAALAGVALLAALFVSPRKGVVAALIALALPLAGLGYASYVRSQAASIPPIHDIVSDPAAPLALSERVLTERAATPGSNPVEAEPHVPANPRFGPAAGQSARSLQAAAYADIAPIMLASSPSEAFEAAQTAARAQGWAIDVADAESGRIEARARTLWFGFTDDVVVQVSPAPEGSRIDFRSISRVGVSDLGANAKRLRAFRDAIE
jgi:fatty-acyl-CoA synthase